MAAAQQCVEPLKYQTWILKVSIHCEGCKKKVKKVLQNMEGVYKTTVDSQQHKVVVIGNVELEMILKKLLKAGKHAELWPELKPVQDSCTIFNTSKKSKNKCSDQPNQASESIDKKQIASGAAPVSSKAPNGKASKNGTKGSSPTAEKEKQGEMTAAAPGGGGKKKPNKAPKETNNVDNSTNKRGVGGASEVQVVQQDQANKKALPGGSVAPVLQPAFNHPFYDAITSPMPTCAVVSYSSMQPSLSYAGAYNSALPTNLTYSTSPPGPSYYYYYSSEDYYSNVCSIM